MSERYISLQPAPSTDRLTADGIELTKLPYPFHVNAASGAIDRQWVFEGWALVGFQRDLAVQQIDLWWADYVNADEPEAAVGMYAVTRDAEGALSTHITAIQSVKVSEV